MTTTASAAPTRLYYQNADNTIRYSHNGHPVPDHAAVWAELGARGMRLPSGRVRVLTDGRLRLPNGRVRVPDPNVVTGELAAAAAAAAVAAPVLPICGPCGGVGMPFGGGYVTGREEPPLADRCPDCHGSGRAPASLTVGRVTLTPSGHPSSEELEDWHGVHPSDGAGLFVRCYAPASLAPGRDPSQPWEIILWPGWEDGSSVPDAALDGPGYPTRAAAVAALGAACRARYGPAWDHEPHHCRELFHADGGAWQAKCTRCPWSSPLSSPEDPGAHLRHANDHTVQEREAAIARTAAVEQGLAADVEREPVPAAGTADDRA